MGRLVVEEAADERGLPEFCRCGSCGAEEVGFKWLFCWGTVGALALDLRLEPNPRPLKREFIELIWFEGRNQCEGEGRGGGERIAEGFESLLSAPTSKNGARSVRERWQLQVWGVWLQRLE